MSSTARPVVVAHRGGAGLVPENTLAAFEHAASLGVDGFELDVQLSRDGVAVALHDPTLDRTTNRTGLAVRLTADELRDVDAGYHFKPEEGFPWRGRTGGIPRLRDLLSRFPAHQFIVEMKGASSALVDAVLGDLDATAAADRVTLAAFASRPMWRVRSRNEHQKTCASYQETRWALYRHFVGLAIRRPRYDVLSVPEVAGRTRVISPGFVRAAHDAGLSVFVWTIDAPGDMERLLTWGVDGLVTDRPDLAVPTVNAWRGAAADTSGM